MFIGDYTTQFLTARIIISHYKNPFEPISIMECYKGFEPCPCLYHFPGIFRAAGVVQILPHQSFFSYRGFLVARTKLAKKVVLVGNVLMDV